MRKGGPAKRRERLVWYVWLVLLDQGQSWHSIHTTLEDAQRVANDRPTPGEVVKASLVLGWGKP